jgi:uncharacterized NAD-dependent epimerase/dehydratase family protein
MVVHSPFPIRGRRLLLLANGCFSTIEGKTASCFLMYRRDDVAAVVDAANAGRAAREVVGFGGDVPVVASVEAALPLGPEVAVVGSAPRGGALEEPMRADIAACLRAGIGVASGLHFFLCDDPELSAIAARGGARVWDVRRPGGGRTVSTGRGCTTGARVVLTVGSDCNVGKMTTTVALYEAAVARGVRAAWAATGQTGMMLRERGAAVDAVAADFIGGAAEALVQKEGRGADLVFVEGQGSLAHPGYAGVTVGLMYGAMPDCMVLVHWAGRERLKRLDVPVPPLPALVSLHESLMRPHRDSRVVAVSLNTGDLDERRARSELEAAARETGLPATDVVRFGCDAALDAIDRALAGARPRGRGEAA